MFCIECYWCKQENPLDSERVCCNENSENYNKVFSEEDASIKDCELAVKYYM